MDTPFPLSCPHLSCPSLPKAAAWSRTRSGAQSGLQTCLLRAPSPSGSGLCGSPTGCGTLPGTSPPPRGHVAHLRLGVPFLWLLGKDLACWVSLRLGAAGSPVSTGGAWTLPGPSVAVPTPGPPSPRTLRGPVLCLARCHHCHLVPLLPSPRGPCVGRQDTAVGATCLATMRQGHGGTAGR